MIGGIDETVAFALVCSVAQQIVARYLQTIVEETWLEEVGGRRNPE